MDDNTARQLADINAAFYARRAADFSASREGPWPGWRRLHGLLDAEGLPAAARVLDVGCGNARLGRFLAEARPALRYSGLDSCGELIAIAQAEGRLGTAPEFLEIDLVGDDLTAALGARRFDLIAGFGLLHHVPGRARRRALLATLLARLAPGGLMALTCWRLVAFARFRDKIVPWEAAQPPVDPGRLEPGDHLLPFGDGGGLRYVHFAHEDETAELLAELPVERVASWRADGQNDELNQYFVVRATRPRP
ncbi:MAG: class I SAM-dependent methyltransferase [Deltaproteobacteria bacterium]|nr:class I SAM-dependent methyltransferase [Deltaproteobacteria bacterium]MBW2361616.1 class I SAM-dependent methyltransferase [Deltaproteobacteria bacterium]